MRGLEDTPSQRHTQVAERTKQGYGFQSSPSGVLPPASLHILFHNLQTSTPTGDQMFPHMKPHGAFFIKPGQVFTAEVCIWGECNLVPDAPLGMDYLTLSGFP